MSLIWCLMYQTHYNVNFLSETFQFAEIVYDLKLKLKWCVHLSRSLFLCRLPSIAAHRDHFARRLSVSICPSVR